MSRIRSVNDLLAGLFLVAVALVGLALSWKLRTGIAVDMGPGYVPKLLCWLQIALGVAIALQGLLVEGERPEAWLWRPILWILASVAFFAVTVERFGLVVAVLGTVILSTLAHAGTRATEAVLLAAGLAAFATLVFVVALGLPMPVWPLR
jgi:hypothetical protein